MVTSSVLKSTADDFSTPSSDFWLPGDVEARPIEPTAGAEPLLTEHARLATSSRVLLDRERNDGEESRAFDLSILDPLAKQAALTSDEFIALIGRRLGIVPRSHNLQSVDAVALIEERKGGVDQDEAQFDSDDDMFNEDDDALHVISSNRTFIETAVGETPHSAEEAAKMARKNRLNARQLESPQGKRALASVPYLSMGDLTNKGAGESICGPEKKENGSAWRNLPKLDIPPEKLISDFGSKRTLSADEATSNQVNKPTYLQPVISREYAPETFDFPYVAEFIPDVRKHMMRAVRNLNRNLRREEEIARLVPSADETLGAQEMTSVEIYLQKQQIEAREAYNADQENQLLLSASELRANVVEKAILAAKTSNVSVMEEALDRKLEGGEISPDDTTDELGNTLLILAAQQGSKRLCKLLLRRGANINRQNAISGNTCLHFCYAFSHKELAKYLISKGADDTILNAAGFTCYEHHLIEGV